MNTTSFLNRMSQWLQERFPFINFVSGFFLFLLAKSVVMLDQQNLSLQWIDLFGLVIPAAHLFLLRVFDEHKDFKSDAVFYPNRVLQRGIFTLKEVKILGWIAFSAQIISYFILRKGLLSDLAFLWLWIWTALMYKEFFCGEWLKQKLFLYGLLHLLVTPFLILSLMLLCIDDLGTVINFKALGLPLLISVLTGWLYELARKIKAPMEESGDLSYSSLWGITRSVLVFYVSTVLTVLLCLGFFMVIGIFNNYTLFIGFGVIFVARVSTRAFRLNPSTKARKNNEGVTLLVSLFAFVPPIIKVLFLL